MNHAQDFKQWKACGRKKRYATQPEASVAATQFHQQQYRCRYCGGFHLTSALTKTLTAIRSKGRRIL